MRMIRWLLGKMILFFDRIFAPVPVLRSPEAQRKIDGALKDLVLYEYEACPFCVKVRRFMRGAAISIPLRNAKVEPFRSELLAGGGKLQVPCLKILNADGSMRWLFESKDIIQFLKERAQL